MFRRTSHGPTARSASRRGAILLVVLTMLALFAVIGLSFVLYAESEASASRLNKQAANADLKPIDATDAINGFLGQMIFQQDTDGSALNGHELARLMYGQPGNTSAYNGVGVYSEKLKMTFSGVATTLDRTQIVRFGLIPGTTDKFILPDRTYAADPTVYDYTTPPTGLNLKYVGRNGPYTYPDRNNIYLAVQDPGTGKVVKPSYHAPSLFGSLDRRNPNWYTPEGYFQLLRPRTIDNLTATEISYLTSKGVTWPIAANMSAAALAALGTQLDNIFKTNPPELSRVFPFPAPNPDGSYTGDVQNVKYGEDQQRADSVWIDAKLPQVNFRGRKLQPLIAATVLDLGGRVNYTTAGNLAVGSGTVHGSNQGFGPAEVSLLKILQAADTVTPAPSVGRMIKQRYGNNTYAPPPPGAPARTNDLFHPESADSTNAAKATYPPTYSPVDFDGNGAAQPAVPTNFSTSYKYPAATFGNSDVSVANQEGNRPALFFNPYHWNPLTIAGGVTTNAGNDFPISDARYLSARYSEKPKYALNATYVGNFDVSGPPAIKYAESSPGHAMNRIRALLTPTSNRLSRPGQAPMAMGNLVNPAGLGNNFGSMALALPSSPTPGVANLSPVLLDPNPAATVPTPAGPQLDLSAGKPYTSDSSTYAINSAVGGDITGSPTTNAANLRAFLQGVDLNRPLADYRDLTTRPLVGAPDQNWPFVPGVVPSGVAPIVTVTPASSAQANAERQALATDIFQRLCVALNARIYYTPATGVILPRSTGAAGSYLLTEPTPAGAPVGFLAKTWMVTQAEYDALRWVAQLSANLVDAIDPDDVSTVFQWNSPPPPVAGGPPSALTAFTPDAPGGLGDCVVFGVEKPKLVVNEVYAEIANKQADYDPKTDVTAADKYTVRFFVELLNPNNAEGPAYPAAPVDQSARNAGYARLQFAANGPGMPAYSAYRVQVYDNGLALHNELASTTNFNYVLGQPTVATVPKLQMTFDAAMTPALGDAYLVEPNNGAFASTVGATPLRNGFCVVGPKLTATPTETPPTAYAPQQTSTTSVDGFMLPKTPVTPAPTIPDQLEYDSAFSPVKPDDIVSLVVDKSNANGHAVVLQRLANPYMPPNGPPGSPGYNATLPYNPYLGVDYMAGVRINDGIRLGIREVGKPDGKRSPAQDLTKNVSLGRVQPYAGYQQLPLQQPVPPGPAPAPGTQYFQTDPTQTPLGQTLTVLQNPTAVPAAPSSPTKTTFFQHNSAQAPSTPPTASEPTLILPFSEPFHPDRRLINPLEALHLTAGPSHLLTRNFATPDTSSTPATPKPPFLHQEELSRVAFPTAAAGAQPSILYRALDVLNVKPWTYGVPHAGRTPGALNVNAIWDQLNKTAGTAASGESTVFQALLDAQTANLFTPAEVNALWQRLRASRNPNWDVALNAPGTSTVPAALGATVDEWDPNATPPGPGKDRPFKGYGVGQYDTSAGGMLSAQGLESTLLRSGATPGTPLFLDTAQTDPYRQIEALRKATNNLTTVSDNFLVVFTVGFFDIDEPSLPRVVLRREAYEQVPGDLRSQFTAVIDRTGLAIDANGGGGTSRFAQAAATNFARLLPDYASGGKNYAQYSLSLPADATSTTTRLKVRDMPTATGSLFSLEVGSSVRVGDGPNASTMAVISLSVFDAATGLVTATLNSGIEVDAAGNPVIPAAPALPQRLPNHAAGELVSLPDNELQGAASAADRIFVPGNPGKVPNFSPGGPAFRGVVRYFGQLKP